MGGALGGGNHGGGGGRATLPGDPGRATMHGASGGGYGGGYQQSPSFGFGNYGPYGLGGGYGVSHNPYGGGYSMGIGPYGGPRQPGGNPNTSNLFPHPSGNPADALNPSGGYGGSMNMFVGRNPYGGGYGGGYGGYGGGYGGYGGGYGGYGGGYGGYGGGYGGYGGMRPRSGLMGGYGGQMGGYNNYNQQAYGMAGIDPFMRRNFAMANPFGPPAMGTQMNPFAAQQMAAQNAIQPAVAVQASNGPGGDPHGNGPGGTASAAGANDGPDSPGPF